MAFKYGTNPFPQTIPAARPPSTIDLCSPEYFGAYWTKKPLLHSSSMPEEASQSAVHKLTFQVGTSKRGVSYRFPHILWSRCTSPCKRAMIWSFVSSSTNLSLRACVCACACACCASTPEYSCAPTPGCCDSCVRARLLLLLVVRIRPLERKSAGRFVGLR